MMGAVTNARQRPSFGSGGDFILETRREVEAYVQSGRVRRQARQKHGQMEGTHPSVAKRAKQREHTEHRARRR